MRATHPLQTKPIIDGLDVDTGRTVPVIRPSTGEPFAEVSRGGPAEIDAAVRSAKKAFLAWSKTSVRERQRFLAALLAEVLASHEEIANLIALEQGKPVGEARAVDIVPVADTLRYLSRYAGELLAPRPVEYEQILFAHKK